jgi:hypothetical protein
MSDLTEPPIARVDVVRETLHGITLEDPYRWMETEGEEFHHWLDGQARHAREHLDALAHRSGLLTRIRELGSALTRYFGLAMAGERVFAPVREPDTLVPVLAGLLDLQHRREPRDELSDRAADNPDRTVKRPYERPPRHQHASGLANTTEKSIRSFGFGALHPGVRTSSGRFT